MAVEIPKSGEPIKATWGAEVAEAVNSALGVPPGGNRGPGGTTYAPVIPGANPATRFIPLEINAAYSAEEEETHAYIFAPTDPAKFVRVISAHWGISTVYAGQSFPTTRRLDLGMIQQPETVEIRFYVPTSTYNARGVLYLETVYFDFGIYGGGQDPNPPAGMRDISDFIPRIVLAEFNSSLGFLQYKKGHVAAHFVACDDDASADSAGSASYPSFHSIGNTNGAFELYGFTSPNVITNPWHESESPSQTETDFLVPVRCKQGNYYLVQYVKLSEAGEKPPEPPTPYDPEEDSRFDNWFSLMGQPCNDTVDHETYYAWNPCRSEWADLADGDNPIFWRTGGDESSCNGSTIGDSSGIPAIGLDAKTLNGSWTVDENLSVSDGFSAYSVSAESYVAIGSGGYIQIGTDHYSPKQITYIGTDGRPHTETILAAQ